MQTIKFTDGRTVELDVEDFGAALRRMASINSDTLRQIDLSGRDLSFHQFPGITFDDCDIDDADFTGANLERARIKGRAEGTRFTKAWALGIDCRELVGKNLDFSRAVVDMGDFRGSVQESPDYTKAVWDVSSLDPAQTARIDVPSGPRTARKYESAGSLPHGADPFEGASVTDAKVDADALPESHRTLRFGARAKGVGSFVAGMAKSKPAKVVALGGAAALWGTVQSSAEGRVGELLRAPVAGSGLDVVAYLKSTAATVTGWVEGAMNAMVPGTSESAQAVSRLAELGLGAYASVALVGTAAIGVMAGAALVDRLEPGKKLGEFARERCAAVAKAVGYDGDLRRYVASRARLLFSSDRKALSSFRSLVDGTERAAGHAMLSHGGGYFMVCDRDEFSMAVSAMRDHAKFEWSDPSMRPKTFWFEAARSDPSLPASLTFVPREGQGVEVVAVWADASGAFSRARVHDRFGDASLEVRADGSRSVSFDAGERLCHLFGAVEGRFEAERFARLPSEVREAFEYDPATHGLSRAHDGTWVLRERATGRLDDGKGALSVYRPASADADAMALSYRGGALEGWATLPAPGAPRA